MGIWLIFDQPISCRPRCLIRMVGIWAGSGMAAFGMAANDSSRFEVAITASIMPKITQAKFLHHPHGTRMVAAIYR